MIPAQTGPENHNSGQTREREQVRGNPLHTFLRAHSFIPSQKTKVKCGKKPVLECLLGIPGPLILPASERGGPGGSFAPIFEGS